ncbi:MAG: DNA-processing protein DprA [Nocardioides sp.]
MSDDDRLARVALSRLTEPGDPKIASLVAQLGAVALRELLSAPTQASPEARDVSSRLRGVDPTADLEAGEKAGLRYLVPGDDEWPTQVDDLMRAELLDHRGGPPLGLWVKGPTRLDQLGGAVAVVGARSATTYGTEVAAGISGTLARAGHPVVSGAAFGIDQAAHRGALGVDGANVAVLACGADRAYPTAHHDLLEHLGRTSAVIAEVPPGCAPTRGRFLSRNRLIAALTRGTVVVEAATRSGALNTASWATRLNRHLMGVPGPVTSAQSQGVHQLLRTGAAALVTYGDEVLEIVAESGARLLTPPRAPSRPRDKLPPRDARVLDAVPLASPAPVDSIAVTAGMALLDVQAALRRLVRDGLVELSERGWRLTAAANE